MSSASSIEKRIKPTNQPTLPPPFSLSVAKVSHFIDVSMHWIFGSQGFLRHNRISFLFDELINQSANLVKSPVGWNQTVPFRKSLLTTTTLNMRSQYQPHSHTSIRIEVHQSPFEVGERNDWSWKYSYACDNQILMSNYKMSAKLSNRCCQKVLICTFRKVASTECIVGAMSRWEMQK